MASTRKHRLQLLLAVGFLFAGPAHAHAGGVEFIAPAAGLLFGAILGCLSAVLRQRFTLALAACCVVVAVFAPVLALALHEGIAFKDLPSATLLSLMFVGVPAVLGFAVAHFGIPRLKQYVATWHRVRLLLRSDRPPR
jgi:hypothetical protein